MRILHVINNGTTCGGAERLTADLAEAQRAAGHLVRVLSSDRTGSGEKYADTTWPVPTGRVARAYTHLYNSAAKTVLAGVVHDLRPDIVHLHTVGLLSPSALSALSAVSTVMTVHGPELFVPGTLRRCLPPGYFRNGDRLSGRLTVVGWLGHACGTSSLRHQPGPSRHALRWTVSARCRQAEDDRPAPAGGRR